MTQSWNDESSSSSTTQTAKQEAGHVASQASQQASMVAGTVQEQGAKVASEAKDQALNLLGQARSQVNEQAGAQQQRAAGSLRSLATDLEVMTNGTTPSGGVTSDVVRQVSQQVQNAADWLESKSADEILNDVRTYARRNPGMFLLVAGGAGLLAGRITRATTQAVKSEQSTSDYSSTSYSTTDYPTSTAPLAAPAAPASVPTTGYSTSYADPAPSTYGTGVGTDPAGTAGTYGEEPLR